MENKCCNCKFLKLKIEKYGYFCSKDRHNVEDLSVRCDFHKLKIRQNEDRNIGEKA